MPDGAVPYQERAAEPLGAFMDARLSNLIGASDAIGFTMRSEPRTWEALRALAASKPGARALETGAGTGLATFWILEGLDRNSLLLSLEGQQRFLDIAVEHLGHDPRVTFLPGSEESALDGIAPGTIDLCFADGEPGKFTALDRVISLLAPGGLYIIDDLSMRPHWPADFAALQNRLLAELYQRKDGVVLQLPFGTGMAVFVKVTHS